MTSAAEREAFSARLKQALGKAGVADSSATVLQRNFNARGFNITVHAARKWLLGEAIPTQEKLVALAAWLGVEPNWLRFGTGDGAQADQANVIPARTLRLIDTFGRLSERDQDCLLGMADQMARTPVAATTGG